MKRAVPKASLLLAALVVFVRPVCAQMPSNFSWINLESDQKTMAIVRKALTGNAITAIREIGLEDGFALVLTTSREVGAPTPDYDDWTIYNISFATGRSQILVSGYGMKILAWIRETGSELAMTYYSCWECEPTKLFTTLHFTKGVGWSARWDGEAKGSKYPQPGAVVQVTATGDPYDDDEVDQIFAVVKVSDNGFAAGSWWHSRDTRTGKIEDVVYRYGVDSATGHDEIQKLSGIAAEKWRREICTKSNALIQPVIGQDSASCQRLLKYKATTTLTPKQRKIPAQ